MLKTIRFKNFLDDFRINSFNNFIKRSLTIKESLKCAIDDEIIFYEKTAYKPFNLTDYLVRFIDNKIFSRNFPDYKYYGLRFFVFKVNNSFHIFIWSGHILHHDMLIKLSETDYKIFDMNDNIIEIPRIEYSYIMLKMEKSTDEDEKIEPWVFPGSYINDEVFCDLDYFKEIYNLYNFKELFKLDHIPQHSDSDFFD